MKAQVFRQSLLKGNMGCRKIIGLTIQLINLKMKTFFICGANSCPLIKMRSCHNCQKCLQTLCFNDARKRRTRSSNKLEAIKDVFEMCNQFLQNGYVSGSCMAADGQVIRFIGPSQACISPKPRKSGPKPRKSGIRI